MKKSIIDVVSLRKAIFNAVFQAMKWKEQQLIGKVCEWVNEQSFGGWIEEPTDEFIEELKQVMEGE